MKGMECITNVLNLIRIGSDILFFYCIDGTSSTFDPHENLIQVGLNLVVALFYMYQPIWSFNAVLPEYRNEKTTFPKIKLKFTKIYFFYAFYDFSLVIIFDYYIRSFTKNIRKNLLIYSELSR